MNHADTGLEQRKATPHGGVWRIWMSCPEWFFRFAGAAIWFSYVVIQTTNYGATWPHLGYYYRFADGRQINLPFVQILIDGTLLSVAIGYCVRVPSQSRAFGFSRVVLPFLAAFWPLVPFWLNGLLQIVIRGGWVTADGFARQVASFVAPSLNIAAGRYVIGCGLLTLGSAIDIWSYMSLRRSISIAAEARQLVTHGPYRWIRHPVYLGQFLSQAGIWLVLRPGSAAQVAYFTAFVAMQLIRARIEERVLAAAFGADYEQHRRRSWWFFN